MNPQVLTLSFTVEEANLILTALGHRPYIEVVGVIQKIQMEAQRQMSPLVPVAAPAAEQAAEPAGDFE